MADKSHHMVSWWHGQRAGCIRRVIVLYFKVCGGAALVVQGAVWAPRQWHGNVCPQILSGLPFSGGALVFQGAVLACAPSQWPSC